MSATRGERVSRARAGLSTSALRRDNPPLRQLAWLAEPELPHRLGAPETLLHRQLAFVHRLGREEERLQLRHGGCRVLSFGLPAVCEDQHEQKVATLAAQGG